jgi:hypothetical protein
MEAKSRKTLHFPDTNPCDGRLGMVFASYEARPHTENAVNIRNQLIRSCVTIGLVVASAAALSAQSNPHEARGVPDRSGADEPLGAVWLPAVAVRARAEPLTETWLPTIHVNARFARLADEAQPIPLRAHALAATLPFGLAH